MKANKISLVAALIAGVMLAGSPALHAQDAKEGKKHEGRPGPGGPAMKEHFDKMAEDLKLTDEQKPKVREAFKGQAEKIRALRADSNLTEEQKREKGKALRDEMTNQMKGILTAEQFEKWEKMRTQRGPGGPGGHARGPRKGGDDKK